METFSLPWHIALCYTSGGLSNTYILSVSHLWSHKSKLRSSFAWLGKLLSPTSDLPFDYHFLVWPTHLHIKILHFGWKLCCVLYFSILMSFHTPFFFFFSSSPLVFAFSASLVDFLHSFWAPSCLFENGGLSARGGFQPCLLLRVELLLEIFSISALFQTSV